MGIATFLGDKLMDLITGLGGMRDRTQSQTFAGLSLVNPLELEVMYRSDWVARKIVDIVPQDMVREGRRWKAPKDTISKIEAYEKKRTIRYWPKIKQALKRARLMGGSAIFIGIEGQDAATELDPSTVGKDKLAYLTVLAKTQLSFAELDYDPQSADYAEPKMWTMTTPSGVQVRVHPSRLVRFKGPENAAQPDTNSQNVWGDSVLQIIYEAVKNAASTQQHVAGLVPDVRNDVIYVPNLGAILKNPVTSKQLTERFAYAKTMKSTYNMLLLEGNAGVGGNEGGEKWETKQLSFSNLPELIRQYLQIAAGAADIPITRFLGESPGGENSTGEADMRNYYDHIKALQNLELGPTLQVLDEVLLRSAGVTDIEKVWYEWTPLWALSEQDEAEILYKKAQAARLMIGAGKDLPLMNAFALSDALVNSITEDGSLPGLEEAVETHGTLSDTLSELPDPVKQAEQEAKAKADAEERRFSAANENKAPTPVGKKPSAVNDALPRSMYVYRRLNNAKDLIEWAKKAGFKTTLRPSDMHVTVMFSKTPVDWMKMGSDWTGRRLIVQPGGPRVIEKLGQTATVLTFYSNELTWRHMEMKRNGAVPPAGQDDYVAHVTITHAPHDLDVDKLPAYKGVLRFGPELFFEVDPDWQSKVKEV